ncbi:Na+/H+ antiporter NhaA [Mangrovibacterium sp.]|uniref:Na+/H+ antiporter NhaA n=1 Tax=Mangrovibacterium sp. TaxID=1961364 RepID=UPI003561679A
MSPVKRFITEPFDRFIKQESSSSIVLLGVTVLTLLAVNVGLAEPYFELLQSKLTFAMGSFELSKSLVLWINDGLMAVFFFLIGLEIKREVLVGELSSVRKASLPAFAALGGMLFPVLIFLLLNPSKETTHGWAIPMATDIAFTLGILNLLGKRVPYALKVFLTAFAIVDDLGAIIIIAVFYSASIQMTLIMAALGLFLVLLALNYFGIYSKYLYFVVSAVIWVLFLKSGVHATLAGVLVAFAIPIGKKIKLKEFQQNMDEAIQSFKRVNGKQNPKHVLTHDQMGAVNRMDELTSHVQSPLQSLEHKLHGWVGYVIMPIFAFANAGVLINAESFTQFDLSMVIAAALVFGNTIGISLFSWVAIKLNLASLPANTSYNQLFITALLGGVGFTMSLFITNLAFVDPLFIDASKIGILIGSLISGVGGYFLLKSTLK